MSTMTQQKKNALKVEAVGDRELRIERVFDATPERVWRAYSQPELLAQWWGRGNKLEIRTFEFERGGHWRLEEHSDEGVHGFSLQVSAPAGPLSVASSGLPRVQSQAVPVPRLTPFAADVGLS